MEEMLGLTQETESLDNELRLAIAEMLAPRKPDVQELETNALLAVPEGELAVTTTEGTGTNHVPETQRQNPLADAETQSARLIRLVEDLGMFLFLSMDGKCYVSLQRDGHQENLLISGSLFRDLLFYRYFETHAQPPSERSIKEVITVLEGRARFENRREQVYLRVARHGNDLYLDLGDADWRAVRIHKEGWEVIQNPPVRFVRSASMLPLPTPERGGDLSELRTVINIGEDDWPLICGWLVGTLNPEGPFAHLILHGEQGSGKSNLARMLKGLVDPSTTLLRGAPTQERDLMVAAQNSWILSYDNLSRISNGLSDALCRLATGGGIGARRLYTDGEEYLIEAKRPLLFTSITEIATRSDLLDRSIVISLPTIATEQRRPEQEIVSEFEGMKGRLLGRLLDGVSSALHLQETAAEALTGQLPRMADFTVWVTAAEMGMGLQPMSFFQAYNRNREMANDVALEGTPLAQIIMSFVDRSGGNLEETSTSLWGKVLASVATTDPRYRHLPKSVRQLTEQLERMSPNLRAVGYDANRRHKNNGSIWTITKQTQVR